MIAAMLLGALALLALSCSTQDATTQSIQQDSGATSGSSGSAAIGGAAGTSPVGSGGAAPSGGQAAGGAGGDAGVQCELLTVDECASASGCEIISGSPDGDAGNRVNVGCHTLATGCAAVMTYAYPAGHPESCLLFSSGCIPTGWVVITSAVPACALLYDAGLRNHPRSGTNAHRNATTPKLASPMLLRASRRPLLSFPS